MQDVTGIRNVLLPDSPIALVEEGQKMMQMIHKMISYPLLSLLVSRYALCSFHGVR